MIITRQPDIEKFILDELRAYFVKMNSQREGVHLSDLLSPRQAYWQRVKPLPPTDKEIQFFLIGRGHEESLHACSGYEHGEQQEWEGILYTPDFYHNFPDESKTRRGNLAKPGEEAEKYSHYISQVKGYCAVDNKNQGWLRIWSLLEKNKEDHTTQPEFAAYRVEFTDGELYNERERLKTVKSALLEGLRQGNHKLIPQCSSWMCGGVKKKEIEAPYCVTCKKEFSTDYMVQKHTKSKTGSGHEIRPGKYQYYYEPRCKYFEDCKPEVKHVG